MLAHRLRIAADRAHGRFRRSLVNRRPVSGLRVRALGRTSISFAYEVFGPEGRERGPRLTGATVCVVMDLDPQSAGFRQALPIPEDLRAAIEAFGVSA